MLRLNSRQRQSLRCRPIGVHTRSWSSHSQSHFFKVRVGILLQAEHNLDRLLVLDDLGMALGEVTGVLVQRPVAAEHVDECQGDLVEGVVDDHDNPVDALIFQAEVDFVEDDDVDDVHADGDTEEHAAECRADDERNGKHEWCEEVDESFIDLYIPVSTTLL